LSTLINSGLSRELDPRNSSGITPEMVPDIGDLALATALSWIEFRGVYEFLRGRPHLSAWYRTLCARASMLATALVGETQD
jgi:hypothetical protein